MRRSKKSLKEYRSPSTRVEDAFLTGYCARALGGVEKVHDHNFSCGQLVAQDCDMATQFTGHKVLSLHFGKILFKIILQR